MDLPEIIVVLILRHVSQKQRLQQCALVSTVWAAAALAATDSLDLVLKDDNSNNSVIDWINTHGKGLTSLRMGYARYSVIPQHTQQQLSLLPCPQLRSLELCNIGISLQLSPSSPQLLLLSAATALTQLVLTDVAAPATGSNSSSAALPTENLMALSALTALQHLEVDSLVLTGLHVKIADRAGLLRLPSALVPCLTQVKHLVLHDALTEVWALEQLSCLTGLASLGVGLFWGGVYNTPGIIPATAATAAALQHLGSLTALSLTGSDPSLLFDPAVGQSCFSALIQLRSLQILNTRYTALLDPAPLTMLTDLQHLDVSLHFALSQARALELLSWLPQLQDLTYLRLSGVLKFDPPAPASAYAALTASSNLQHLDLSNCVLGDVGHLGVGAPWQLVFAPGKLLPQMTSLQLNGCQPGLGVRSLQYLMRCCPALQLVDLSAGYRTPSRNFIMPYDGEQVSVLLGLTELTSLKVSCYNEPHAVQPNAVRVLAQMPQFQKLDLTFFHKVGLLQPGLERRLLLLPLTQLRQLESLTVQDGSEQKLELRSTEPDGCPPDVWSQLKSLVEGDAPVESWLQGGARALSTAWRYCYTYNLPLVPIVVIFICSWQAWTRGLISKEDLLIIAAPMMFNIASTAIFEAIRYVGKWYERAR